MNLSSRTEKFISEGRIAEDRQLKEMGIDPSGRGATLYYARWIRQDIIGLFHMVHELNEYARLHAVLLGLIAIPLWIIAFR